MHSALVWLQFLAKKKSESVYLPLFAAVVASHSLKRLRALGLGMTDNISKGVV